MEGGIELGLEPVELFRLAVVVNQLAEATLVRYQGHPLRNLSQGSGKATSDTPTQSEEIHLLSVVFDQGPEFRISLCGLVQFFANRIQVPRDQIGDFRAHLTIDDHALFYGDQ